MQNPTSLPAFLLSAGHAAPNVSCTEEAVRCTITAYYLSMQ